MGFKRFSAMGHRIATSWGTDSKASIDEAIKDMPDDKMLLCLAASAVAELRGVLSSINELNMDLKREIRSLKNPRSDECHAVANGLLLCLKVGRPDVAIADMDKSKLGIRARKALIRSGIKMRSEVTRESLEGVKNCGGITIAELIKWADTADNLSEKEKIE